LAGLVDVQRWAILAINPDAESDVPAGVIRPLSRDPKTAEGLEPHCVIFDELHVQPNRALWDVVNLGSATREQPLIVGITTAGTMTDESGGDSICYQLYQYGRQLEAGETVNPAFHFAWYGADPADDWLDPKVWKRANPGYGIIQSADDFAATAKTTPENEFRTKRLNLWVSSDYAWLPTGRFEACATPDRTVADDEPIVLAFDGSRSRDSTAIVAATVEENPHLFIIGLWERPFNAGPDWQIPSADVVDTIEATIRARNVVELVHDPAFWKERFDALEAQYPDLVVGYPNTLSRMVPASQALRARVMESRVTHDGDGRLERHARNAIAKMTPNGVIVAKDGRDSPRKIDALIAAIMATERAAYHAARPVAAKMAPTIL
jgi:phage terminase large subunit-like protein